MVFKMQIVCQHDKGIRQRKLIDISNRCQWSRMAWHAPSWNDMEELCLLCHFHEHYTINFIYNLMTDKNASTSWFYNTNGTTSSSDDHKSNRGRKKKSATAHKTMNVNKSHFKVKLFTLCAGPLKKLPIKLAKCRRDAIIENAKFHVFSPFFECSNFTLISILYANTKSNCNHSLSVNIGKHGDALNTVLPLRVVMQHRQIYHWKNSLRTRFLVVYVRLKYLCEKWKKKKMIHTRDSRWEILPTYRLHADQCALGQLFHTVWKHFDFVISTCTK